MNNSLLTLLEWVRGLTEDHAPDGWPPVRMAQLTALADEIERLTTALADARDCRTCRNYTTRSDGCMSVLRCVDGSGYQRQGRFQYWEAAPLNPAPFWGITRR